jgi:hypothetical protein
VPPHLLQMPAVAAGLTAASGASAGEQDLSGASGTTPAAAAFSTMSSGSPKLPGCPSELPAGPGTRRRAPGAGHTSNLAAAPTTVLEPCVFVPSAELGNRRLASQPLQSPQQQQQQQQQQLCMSPGFPPPSPPGPHPGGGWMEWLAAPSGPLGPDAAQFMPLVAAAKMSSAAGAAGGQAAAKMAIAGAAGAQAGVLPAGSAAGSPALHGVGETGSMAAAAAAAGPADQLLESLSPRPVLDLSPCDAPHSPVPPDLFEREECLTPQPHGYLMEPAPTHLAHLGSGTGDGPSAPAFDLLSFRPDLALPDNALDLLQQLLGGLEGPGLGLPAELLL